LLSVELSAIPLHCSFARSPCSFSRCASMSTQAPSGRSQAVPPPGGEAAGGRAPRSPASDQEFARLVHALRRGTGRRGAAAGSAVEYSSDLRSSFARGAPPSGWPWSPGQPGRSRGSRGHGQVSTRATLVGWLVDVHAARHTQPETLFLATSLIDRYVSLRQPPLGRLQLAGIVALSLAAKFEEDGPLSAADMRELTDEAYEIDEFQSMEVHMLDALEFRLCSTTAIHHFAALCMQPSLVHRNSTLWRNTSWSYRLWTTPCQPALLRALLLLQCC